MDVRMPGGDGIEATRTLAGPGVLDPVAVIVVTAFDLDEYIFGALDAGASGFLLKDAGRAVLTEAVRAAARGDAVVSPTVTPRVIAEFARRQTGERGGRRRRRRPDGQGAGDNPGTGAWHEQRRDRQAPPSRPRDSENTPDANQREDWYSGSTADRNLGLRPRPRAAGQRSPLLRRAPTVGQRNIRCAVGLRAVVTYAALAEWPQGCKLCASTCDDVYRRLPPAQESRSRLPTRGQHRLTTPREGFTGSDVATGSTPLAAVDSIGTAQPLSQDHARRPGVGSLAMNAMRGGRVPAGRGRRDLR